MFVSPAGQQIQFCIGFAIFFAISEKASFKKIGPAGHPAGQVDFLFYKLKLFIIMFSGRRSWIFCDFCFLRKF